MSTLLRNNRERPFFCGYLGRTLFLSLMVFHPSLLKEKNNYYIIYILGESVRLMPGREIQLHGRSLNQGNFFVLFFLGCTVKRYVYYLDFRCIYIEQMERCISCITPDESQMQER